MACSPVSRADQRDTPSTDRGSTLLEALVATLILTTGLLSMADLIRIATASNRLARSSTLAEILADQKMEQLRALTWGFDLTGAPVSDLTTDTTVMPASPAGGTGLQPSPASLQRNTPGFVDYLDAGGSVVGRGAQPPASAVYTRRWSIEPLTAYADRVVLIQVLVTAVRNRGRADDGAGTRLPGDARLVTIKTRKWQ
jgi:hypothetical protein